MNPILKKCRTDLSVAKVSECLLSATVYLCFDAIIACAVVWRANHSRPAILLGLIFVVLGVVTRCFARSVAWEKNLPAIAGIYRFVRAPYLSGSALIWCGSAIAARDLSLLILTIVMVGVVGGIGFLNYERANLRPDQFERQLYVRDVPSLLPLVIGFRLEASKHAGGSNSAALRFSSVRRELPSMAINMVCFICLLLGLRFLSFNFQLAMGGSVVIITVLAYRIFSDIKDIKPRALADRLRI